MIMTAQLMTLGDIILQLTAAGGADDVQGLHVV